MHLTMLITLKLIIHFNFTYLFLLQVMNHCDVRGSEAYCGDKFHVFKHEQSGAAQLGGVSLYTLPMYDNGTFDLNKLERAIRFERLHEPIAKLVIAENPHNGAIVPQTWIKKLTAVARKNDLKMHLDGARLWNASVALGISVKELAAPFDSVSFCLSKGLGAPVGSLLCGSKNFISSAKRRRKVLGGGMRQAGVLAATGLVALEETVPRLIEDHRRTRTIAQAINRLNSKIFTVNMELIQTNMIFVKVNSDRISATTFMNRLHQVEHSDEDDKVIIRCQTLTEKLVRLVLHYDIDNSQMDAAIRKLTYVIREFDV